MPQSQITEDRIPETLYEATRELSLRVLVNSICNHRCTFCFREASDIRASGEELPIHYIITAARYAAQLGISRLRLSGGEPLLRKDICHIVEQLLSIGEIDTGITTNGSRLQKLVKPLYLAGLRKINVSVPSVTAGLYERITQSANYHVVLAGIDSALENGMFVTVNVPIVGENMAEIEKIIERFRSTENVRVRFFEILQYRNDYRYTIVTAEDIEAAIRRFMSQASIPTGKVLIRRGREIRGEPCRDCQHRTRCKENSLALRLTCAGLLKPCILNSSLAVDFSSMTFEAFKQAYSRAISIYK